MDCVSYKEGNQNDYWNGDPFFISKFFRMWLCNQMSYKEDREEHNGSWYTHITIDIARETS